LPTFNDSTQFIDGNLIDAGGGWTFQYDATGQQTWSAQTSLSQAYDDDRLPVQKTEGGAAMCCLRSSVLGGRVVAESQAAGGSGASSTSSP